MRFSRRLAWLFLLMGAGLVAGLIFREFFMADVVYPIAVVLQMFGRLLQSIHQEVYWWGVIAAALGLISISLVLAVRVEDAPSIAEPYTVINVVSYWRLLLQLDGGKDLSTPGLRQQLRFMLVALHAVKQHGALPLEVDAALNSRQMPLPESIHSFLFGDETRTTKPSWKKRVLALAARPVQWFRYWTGRERAEYYRAVDETLAFMESLLEIEHGDDYFETPSR
jgi:hypothetical protein